MISDWEINTPVAIEKMATAQTMQLRIRHQGEHFLLSGFSSGSKLSDVMKAIEEKTGILQCNQMSFPPKEIRSYRPSLSMDAAGIKSRETLIVKELPPEERRIQLYKAAGMDLQEPAPSGEFVRKSVTANNSCLFQSISILTDGGSTPARELRQVVAGIIQSDPVTYTDSVLEQSRDKYVQWIQRDDSWGGAIELAILSEHFRLEFAVVDVQTLRVDRFGCNKDYLNRAYLLYDGVHYDPLVFKQSDGRLKYRFSADDDQYTLLALNLAKEAHKAFQYTDRSAFSLRCLLCNKLLKGEVEALRHAQTTGHQNFGEVKK